MPDRPVVVTILGVAASGAHYHNHRAPDVNGPLPSLILQGRLPLMPCHHPGPWSNGSRPGAIATTVLT
jgi:hypothetical protein